jgi:hypothetical protein
MFVLLGLVTHSKSMLCVILDRIEMNCFGARFQIKMVSSKNLSTWKFFLNNLHFTVYFLLIFRGGPPRRVIIRNFCCVWNIKLFFFIFFYAAGTWADYIKWIFMASSLSSQHNFQNWIVEFSKTSFYHVIITENVPFRKKIDWYLEWQWLEL